MLITGDEAPGQTGQRLPGLSKMAIVFSHFAHFDMILIPQPGHALTNPGIQVGVAHMRHPRQTALAASQITFWACYTSGTAKEQSHLETRLLALFAR